jgi:hypothetical protein
VKFNPPIKARLRRCVSHIRSFIFPTRISSSNAIKSEVVTLPSRPWRFPVINLSKCGCNPACCGRLLHRHRCRHAYKDLLAPALSMHSITHVLNTTRTVETLARRVSQFHLFLETIKDVDQVDTRVRSDKRVTQMQ